jgi:preprotein translocase subunit SecD
MLLCEIYPDENKLKHALFLMSIGKQKAKVNQYAIGSRVYERLKKEHSKFLTGKKQSKETSTKKSESMKQYWASLTQDEKDQIFEKTKQSNTGRKITWGSKIQNSLKNRKIEWDLKTSKPIIQYDLQGNFIKEWPSRSEAKRWLGSGDIAGCLAGKQKQAGGFIWKFK